MSIFGKLIKVAVDTTVRLPVAVVKDVATLGGSIIGEDEPFTVQQAKKLGKDVKDTVKDLEDL